MPSPLLRIDGEVNRPITLDFADLEALDPQHQVADVSRLDPKRVGDAVTLAGVLQAAGLKANANYLGLHGSLDNFHASIPLQPVLDRGLLIYRLNGQPLDTKSGGPIRFLIPDYAACHTAEIDECANVKFVDHIEVTVDKGFDNRPDDEAEHQELHRRQEADH